MGQHGISGTNYGSEPPSPIPVCWVRPAAHETDPPSGWADPEKAYDTSTTTYAITNMTPPQGWSSFLVLLLSAPILVQNIRVWPLDFPSIPGSKINLDVYYNDAWHHVYEGVYSRGQYNNYNMPEGVRWVSKLRISIFNNSFVANEYNRVMDAAVYQVHY